MFFLLWMVFLRNVSVLLLLFVDPHFLNQTIYYQCPAVKHYKILKIIFTVISISFSPQLMLCAVVQHLVEGMTVIKIIFETFLKAKMSLGLFYS